MVHQGSKDWCYGIPMIELAIDNIKQDSTGLFAVYCIWDSDQEACGYAGWGLWWSCWFLGGLGDEGDPRAGTQAMMHSYKAQKDQDDRNFRDVEYDIGQKLLLNTRNLMLKLLRKL